jgi:hypothetical protein
MQGDARIVVHRLRSHTIRFTASFSPWV